MKRNKMISKALAFVVAVAMTLTVNDPVYAMNEEDGQVSIAEDCLEENVVEEQTDCDQADLCVEDNVSESDNLSVEENTNDPDDVICSDPVSADLASKSSGSGTQSSPWNYELGEAMVYEGDDAEHYYTFTPSDDGVITIEGYVPKHENRCATAIFSIYDNNYSEEEIIKEQMFEALDTYKQIAKIGVKKNTPYTVILRTCKDTYDKSEYAFRISFEQSAYWEAECDAPDRCKDISLNTKYSGSLGMATNPKDYYHFSLNKKSKITLFLQSEYSSHIAIYKSNAFSDESRIGEGFESQVWEPVYTFDNAIDAGDYYVGVFGSGSPNNLYSFQIKTDGSSGSDPASGKSKSTGSGTKADPWNVVIGEDIEGGAAPNGEYYYFTTTDEGVITLDGCIPDGAGNSGRMVMSDESGTIYFDSFIMSGNTYNLTQPSKIGVKKGTKFIVCISTGSNYQSYRFRVSFTKDKYYETEPDSKKACKEIEFNKEYKGMIKTDDGDPSTTLDMKDYYHFKLKKDTKLEIKLISTAASHLAIYKKNDFADPMGQMWNKANAEKGLDYKFYAGDYYIMIDSAGVAQTTYTLSVNTVSGGNVEPETGLALLNGVEAKSLKTAFYNVNDPAVDYEVQLQSDMKGEKDLTIPAKAKSVIIDGNGKTIEIIGSKLTANCDVTLRNVIIKTVNNAGNVNKFTLTAKKSLTIGEGVVFDTTGTNIKAGGNVILNSSVNPASLTGKDVTVNKPLTTPKLTCKALTVNADLTSPKVSCTDLTLNKTLETDSITCNNLTITATGAIKTSAKGKYTVKKDLNAQEGSAVVICDGFKNPVTINGTAKGKLKFVPGKNAEGQDVKLSDGTQLLKCAAKKISADDLKTVFDVSGIKTSAVDAHLYYFTSGKAMIFADSIKYNGKTYGIWKDAVAQMNADYKAHKREGVATQFVVELFSDVNCKGAFKMPSKGYESITIKGNGKTVTFTGDISLTGHTLIENLTFKKINAKGIQIAGKIKKGKYVYNGPEDNKLDF